MTATVIFQNDTKFSIELFLSFFLNVSLRLLSFLWSIIFFYYYLLNLLYREHITIHKIISNSIYNLVDYNCYCSLGFEIFTILIETITCTHVDRIVWNMFNLSTNHCLFYRTIRMSLGVQMSVCVYVSTFFFSIELYYIISCSLPMTFYL